MRPRVIVVDEEAQQYVQVYKEDNSRSILPIASTVKRILFGFHEYCTGRLPLVLPGTVHTLQVFEISVKG